MALFKSDTKQEKAEKSPAPALVPAPAPARPAAAGTSSAGAGIASPAPAPAPRPLPPPVPVPPPVPMPAPAPAMPGRIVPYRLTAEDCERILEARARPSQHGAEHHPGDVVPLVIVRWSTTGISGQAFLDGNDALWIRSASCDQDANGAWFASPKAGT